MAFRNVLVYVCDALRWDSVPSAVADEGVTFKTVAQSTWSPPGFATLSTGRYPERHGVFKFHNELADGVRTVYDVEGLDGAYYNKHPNDRLADIFGVPQDRTIEDLEEPFFYLERDLTTHAPYDEVEGTDANAYLAEVQDDWGRLRQEYQRGVEKSESIFRERLASLRDRGILEDTLVIFTADHGESLGERGEVGHSNPTCPEVVYVPTVFSNPSLTADDFAVDPASDVVEQVDVVQTALSAIGFDEFRTDGVDLQTRRRNDDLGYNYVRVEKRGITFYEAKSAWDRDGGHVFLSSPTRNRLAYYLYRQLRSSHRHSIRANWRTVLGQYTRDTYRFGSPKHTQEAAREYVDEKADSFDEIETREATLSEETEDQLREMGYLS